MRRAFQMFWPDGEYFFFEGTVLGIVPSGDLLIAQAEVSDVEIIERGSIYDKQGAD